MKNLSIDRALSLFPGRTNGIHFEVDLPHLLTTPIGERSLGHLKKGDVTPYVNMISPDLYNHIFRKYQTFQN